MASSPRDAAETWLKGSSSEDDGKKRESDLLKSFPDKSTWYTGMLSKAGAKGKSVMGMSNMKLRFFAMSPDGKLFYYESKEDFETGKPALNDIAFDLTQCVIKFDLSRPKSSKHHPINIAPKNWQGGEKELLLEARSVEIRDEWRGWIRQALALEKSSRESGGGGGGATPKLSRSRSSADKPSSSGPQARPSGSPRAGGRPSPARGPSFSDSGSGGPGLRPSPRGPPGGPPRNSNSPSSPRSPRLSGGSSSFSASSGGGSGNVSPSTFKSATPEEARTEVGAMLRECRLEEFTHKLVSIEKFSLLSDLRILSPSDFDELAIKVGLKLGQSRKLKKRLGIALTDAPKDGGSSSLSASMGGMLENLGMGLVAPSTSAVPEMSPREQEAWDMVQRLEGEVKLLREALGKDHNKEQASSLDAMMSGLSPFGSSESTDTSSDRQKRSSEQEIAIGKLLTHQIPVVVAFGEVAIGTIAHDAGNEDNAVRRLKFEQQDIGFDVKVHLFGEPLTVTSVTPGGPAAMKGVEVGDLLIDANGSAIPTDRPEFELRESFAKFKRPITLGFYKMRKANEASRMQLLSLTAASNDNSSDVRAVATQVSGAGGIGGANQPQQLQVDGCPDEDCNGKYTLQPNKIVNGYARYLKNHSFYYLYKTSQGYWMITWFEPDIEEDKGEYRSEEIVGTPEEPTRWVSGTSGEVFGTMVVYVHGSVPFQQQTSEATAV